MTAIGLTSAPIRPIAIDYYMPSMPPLWLLDSARSLFQSWQYRRKLARLLSYDDHMLEDMGYTRAELLMAIELPLKQDPRPQLKAWKALRRQTG